MQRNQLTLGYVRNLYLANVCVHIRHIATQRQATSWTGHQPIKLGTNKKNKKHMGYLQA